MTSKLFLGIATFIPGAYCIVFLVLTLLILMSQLNPTYEFIRNLVVLHAICLLLLIGLLIFYVRHIRENSRLVGQEKTLWIVALIIASVIAMPIYWYSHVFHST
jgi:hypothetical protein